MSESVTITDIYKLFEQTNASLERSREEFNRSMAESRAEADRIMAKLEKTVERTSKSVDSLTTRWGRFVEELVRPAVVRLFRDRDILITRTMERVRSPQAAFSMEIDILGVNGMKVVAGIEINEGIDLYAYRKGLFVIRTSGDTVEIANDQKFKAMSWG